MLRQEAARHAAVPSHPYAAETQGDFAPSLATAAAVDPGCLERACAARCMCDAACVAPGAPLVRPWWRRGVAGPGPVSAFFAPARAAPSPLLRAGEGAGLPWWESRDPPSTAWYQLNYGLPAASVPAEQPYNITGDATASEARGGFAFLPPRAADAAVDDGPAPPKEEEEEESGGVSAELLELRRRVEAVEAMCCRRDVAGDEERRGAGASAAAAQPSLPEAPIASSPPSPSPSPPRTPEKPAGITLDRLMKAVRRARERAKEQDRQQLLASLCSEPGGAPGPASALQATAEGTAPQRAPPKT
ncbi:uncharacterized protein Tco025E_01323 [Trypanosoma conorhini]|uniref:Uncharacterized protein n=1 Tax=Trypanosoma conorhini TaxID=83891 RepID=A0A3R7PWS6_9TRYP|nr:uncharacterized protein Tco025E_01323 [Trypanosoma conorhini]RNF26363.1 hypothetical protein Tco025E_01323 [Trypanosoma conorhini]